MQKKSRGFNYLAMTQSKGTYILILMMARPRTINVGNLGPQQFTAGYFAYVGSAFGPGGLQARLKRHMRRSRSAHWHIDYLRRAAKLVQIWYSDYPNKLEHPWARQILASRTTFVPVPGFGSSDCRCPSHLFGLPEASDSTYFNQQIRPRLSRAETIRSF